MYKAVIFDLDGTLLNTLTDLYNSVNFALRAFGFPERTLDEVRRFIGNGVKKLMERSTPDGTDEKTNEKCLDCFREHYLLHMADTTAPYEGVQDLILKLKSRGIKTAVVSNKLHSAVVDLCRDYFPELDCAFGVTKESERKPNPINVLKVLDTFGFAPDECIYVGDSEVDVETSHNASLQCIGVTWGYRDEKELRDSGAEFVVNTAEEVYRLINAKSDKLKKTLS